MVLFQFARSWRKRWLSNRIENQDVISRVRSEGADAIFASLQIEANSIPESSNTIICDEPTQATDGQKAY